MPTLIKTEFWGGPKDGDRQLVPGREKGVAYDARDHSEVHVYVFASERNRMEYMGLIGRDLVGTGTVLPLKVGERG